MMMPLFEDPRKYSVAKLKSECLKYNLPIRCNKKEMIGELINYKISTTNLKVEDLDNLQPEKWALNSNIEFEKAQNIEPNGDERIKVMKIVNEFLLGKCVNELTDIALNYVSEDKLFESLTKFGASIMISNSLYYGKQMTVEMIASIYLTGIYTGYGQYEQQPKQSMKLINVFN